jgi:hypothetical protein
MTSVTLMLYRFSYRLYGASAVREGSVEMNGRKRLGRGLWDGGACEQRGRDGTASLLHGLKQWGGTGTRWDGSQGRECDEHGRI